MAEHVTDKQGVAYLIGITTIASVVGTGLGIGFVAGKNFANMLHSMVLRGIDSLVSKSEG